MARPEPDAAQRNDRLAAGLEGFLADSYLLMGKTQACHWNVTGPNFNGLHALFEAQYKDLFEAVDVIAERMRALGAPAPASTGAMLAKASLKDSAKIPDAMGMVRMLAEDHAAMSRSATQLAGTAGAEDDLATQDLLAGRIAVHDKARWMLRSHLD